jgi:PAS domain S-box-containing protein
MKAKATRVLLVEDNPGDARLIQEMLREAGEGYQLEWVPQLSDGLERLARGEIDLVLLDLGLPDSQGVDTFIRAFSHAPQVPFVVLSGLDDETIAVTAVREGAQDYLVKGQVDGSLLVRAMRYAGERKRAEEAVRESEEKYRLLVQQIPAVVFKGYLDWRVDFFDDKIEALSGYAKEDFDAGRLRWIDLILPDDLEETKRTFKEALKTTGSYVQEYRIRRKNGEIRWVQNRGRIFCDADGQVHYIDGVVFDITEGKQAGEALKQARDELELRVAERTGELTLANQQLQEEVGRRRQTEAALKQARDELEHKVAERTAELTLANVQLQLEVEERRRAEGALLQSQARFKAFMRHLPGVAYMRDRQGRYLFANEAWGKAFYRGSKDWFGKTLEEIWPPEVAARIRENDVACLRGQAKQSIEALEQEDGVHYWLSHRFPILDESGRVLLLGGVAIDITEQERAEEQLRESEERFRATFEQAAVGLALVGPDLKWLRVNQKLCDIVGYSREELLGGTFQDITYPEDLEPNLHLYRQLRAGEIQTYGMEKRYVRKDDSLVWINLTVSMVREPSGEPKYSIAVIEDITARKQAEAELRVSEARFRELFDNMSSGVSVFEAVDQGRDFIFKDFNRAGERIDQIRKSDLVGHSVLEKFPGVQEFGLFSVLQRVWQSGAPEFFPAALYKDERLSGWRENYVYKLPSGEVVAIFEDITAKKEAEERLRESEKKYRRLVENAQEGIWRIDAAGNTIFVNERMAEMLGYSVEEMLGQPISRFTDESGAEKARRNFELRKQGLREQFDFEFLKKDCSRLHAIIEDTPIFDDDGNFAGALGCIIDITRRKQAEEALRASEEKYRRLFDASNDAIFAHAAVTDREAGRFSEVNEVACRMLGYTREELLKLSVADIGDPEKAGEFPVRREKLRAEKQILFETTLVTKNGRKIPVEVSSRLFELGGRTTVLSVVRDITERQRAQKALEAERHRLFSLLDELPAFVYLVAPDYSIRFANRVFREDIGQPAGKLCHELLRQRPTPCEECPTFEVFRTGKQQSFEWSRFDGRTYQIYEYSFTDVDGSPLVLVLGADITTRKQAEEQLQESEKNLRYLASQLLNAQERERRRISRELHDELGQSLLVLKLQLQAIAKEQGKARHHGVKEDLGDVIAYVDGVVDNVRRLSRDLSPTVLEDLGFSAALKRLLEGFQKHYDLQEFSLDLDEIDSLMSPEAKINIYRVFQECLTNIGKYAQAGRVAVSIKKRKGQILFQVEDNGKGFNMAQVLGASVSSRGLGLAAMEERVRMLGGSLKLRSREGSGTKISFTIPINHSDGTS